MKHKFVSLLFLSLSLTACESVGNFADRVGNHMPVIGERCEHWQCFTEGGQLASQANREERLRGEAGGAKAEKKEETEDPTALYKIDPPRTAE